MPAFKITNLLLIILYVALFSCKTKQQFNYTPINKSEGFFKKTDFSTQIQHWQHLDIVIDSIPGISLERAYKSLLQNKKDFIGQCFGFRPCQRLKKVFV